jgi:hypothetical protein
MVVPLMYFDNDLTALDFLEGEAGRGWAVIEFFLVDIRSGVLFRGLVLLYVILCLSLGGGVFFSV